jgi:hypothetical protein
VDWIEIMNDHRSLFDQYLAALPLIAILRGITPAEAVAVGEELVVPVSASLKCRSTRPILW